LNVNKNYGFEKATSDWILSLDADERITPELAQEIRMMTNQYNNHAGYWIPRKNIIFGKWIEHTGWYPDYQLRLFKKGKGKFLEKHVHEMLHVEGETAKLQHPLLHLNYETVQQFIGKMSTIYTPNEAKNLQEKGYKVSYFDVITMPAKEFISRFFAQQGYKDGFHGLVLSLLQAFYYLLIVINVWQEEKFTEIKGDKEYLFFAKELRKIQKELMYWYVTSLVEIHKNPIKKLQRKIKRKFQQ